MATAWVCLWPTVNVYKILYNGGYAVKESLDIMCYILKIRYSTNHDAMTLFVRKHSTRRPSPSGVIIKLFSFFLLLQSCKQNVSHYSSLENWRTQALPMVSNKGSLCHWPWDITIIKATIFSLTYTLWLWTNAKNRTSKIYWFNFWRHHLYILDSRFIIIFLFYHSDNSTTCFEDDQSGKHIKLHQKGRTEGNSLVVVSKRVIANGSLHGPTVVVFLKVVYIVVF